MIRHTAQVNDCRVLGSSFLRELERCKNLACLILDNCSLNADVGASQFITAIRALANLEVSSVAVPMCVCASGSGIRPPSPSPPDPLTPRVQIPR